MLNVVLKELYVEYGVFHVCHDFMDCEYGFI